jgi:hypothetical protein
MGIGNCQLSKMINLLVVEKYSYNYKSGVLYTVDSRYLEFDGTMEKI